MGTGWRKHNIAGLKIRNIYDSFFYHLKTTDFEAPKRYKTLSDRAHKIMFIIVK